jgi:hypothetical protein
MICYNRGWLYIGTWIWDYWCWSYEVYICFPLYPHPCPTLPQDLSSNLGDCFHLPQCQHASKFGLHSGIRTGFGLLGQWGTVPATVLRVKFCFQVISCIIYSLGYFVLRTTLGQYSACVVLVVNINHQHLPYRAHKLIHVIQCETMYGHTSCVGWIYSGM